LEKQSIHIINITVFLSILIVFQFWLITHLQIQYETILEPTFLYKKLWKAKVNKEDPCEEAKSGSVTATDLSKKAVFDSAKTKIQRAFVVDKNEHVVSFGKDAVGNIILSDINRGNRYNGIIPAISNQFADMHNHPGNSPPFSHDIYWVD